MKITKIPAPAEALYISDFMTELPNGILNKKSCGVGGTHLCIISDDFYIITVPTVELIVNKCSQHDNLLGVYGNCIYHEFDYNLKKQLDKGNVPKIMVTYDSLPKLVSWLKGKYNVYEDFKLLVDEFHVCLSDFDYRGNAISYMLEESLNFKIKCYMSATPINADYTLDVLKNLDHYEIEWQKVVRIKPIRLKTNKPFMATVNIIRNYKAGGYELAVKHEGSLHKSKEAYFFINSVKAIKDIIDNAGLTQDEFKIICADNKRNKTALGGLKINKVSDTNKPFTFVTSKAFLGADFYSETGITYVVTNISNKTCMYSVDTEIFQIAGRIRTTTNPFKNYIYHIYNTGALEMTRAKFEDSVKKKKQDSYNRIENFNSSPPHIKVSMKSLYKDKMIDCYVRYNEKTNELDYDKILELSEDFKFKMVYETYINGFSIREAYLKAGFDLTHAQEYAQETEDFIYKATTMQFGQILKEYCDLYDDKIQNECYEKEERLEHLLALEPKIKEYVDKLGTTKIRALGYSIKAMKQGIYQNLPTVQNAIKIEIENNFKKDTVYTSKEVKIFLQELYTKLDYKKAAKATDVESYFKVDKKKRKIEGKPIDSLIFLN